MGHLLSVNLAVPRTEPASRAGATGIDKQPADGPVHVQMPGPKGTPLGSGLAGDRVFDARHGGDEKAVYAYAREDLDIWAAELGRELRNGVFGENLTTANVDITGALIGERWRISDGVVLEVTVPRIPCRTFAAWMAEQRWMKRFTDRSAPGAYLRVIEPGDVQAGHPVTVTSRPDHDVTIGLLFRALTSERELVPRLRTVEALPSEVKERLARRTTSRPSTAGTER